MSKKIFIISGCDGTGKSTIINGLKEHIESDGRLVETKWLRYIHWSSKIVNGLGRLLGKSFFINDNGFKFGYHNYNGFLGVMYVFTVFLDFKLHRVFFLGRLKRKSKVTIIDRYTPDIIADLILDTGRKRLINFLFSPDLERDIDIMNSFIITCSEDIIISRRKELKSDIKLSKKLEIYNMLARDYGIPIIDSSRCSVIECCSQILDYEKGKNPCC